MRNLGSFLKVTDCPQLYIGGSFITGKPDPGDYDGAWERVGTDINVLYELEPLLMRDLFDSPVSPILKERYGGELFPSDARMKERDTDEHTPAREFFQVDKRTGTPRVTVAVALSTMSISDDPVIRHVILGSEAASEEHEEY